MFGWTAKERNQKLIETFSQRRESQDSPLNQKSTFLPDSMPVYTKQIHRTLMRQLKENNLPQISLQKLLEQTISDLFTYKDSYTLEANKDDVLKSDRTAKNHIETYGSLLSELTETDLEIGVSMAKDEFKDNVMTAVVTSKKYKDGAFSLKNTAPLGYL
jgi:hypothetical protein